MVKGGQAAWAVLALVRALTAHELRVQNLTTGQGPSHTARAAALGEGQPSLSPGSPNYTTIACDSARKRVKSNDHLKQKHICGRFWDRGSMQTSRP